MAKQAGLSPFIGRLGNQIGYEVDGVFFVRAAAEKVQQSRRTKISSRYFGKASKLGARIRHSIDGVLQMPCNGAVVNRLNKALLQVLLQDDLHPQKQFVPRHFAGLQGFSFTPGAEAGKVLMVEPSAMRAAGGNIEVAVPAIPRFAANPRATHVSIRAVVFSIRKNFSTVTTSTSGAVVLPVNASAPSFALCAPADNNAVNCVMLEVTSLKEDAGQLHVLYDKAYHVAEIMAVFMPKAIQALSAGTGNTTGKQPAAKLPPQLPGLVIHAPQLE